MTESETEVRRCTTRPSSLPGQLERSESGVTLTTVIWTDGSCNASGMQGRGGWAALIEQAGTIREMFGSADGTTQNRMELTAICEALDTLTGVIHVFTDSRYVERCFNEKWHLEWRDNSWKGSNGLIKNRDLWERLFGLAVDDPGRVVTFTWVRGHKRDYPNNIRVDRLAQAAALSAV